MARQSSKGIIDANLKKIEKWAAEGKTMKEIAQKLGVSERTLYKYKSQDAKIKQTVKKGRGLCVESIENTMYRSAKGFTQKVKKYEKVKRCKYKDGKKLEEWEEMVEYEEEVYIPPNITAGIFLLKNWGGYVNEPRILEIRQQELEIQKKKAEDAGWS